MSHKDFASSLAKIPLPASDLPQMTTIPLPDEPPQKSPVKQQEALKLSEKKLAGIENAKKKLRAFSIQKKITNVISTKKAAASASSTSKPIVIGKIGPSKPKKPVLPKPSPVKPMLYKISPTKKPEAEPVIYDYVEIVRNEDDILEREKVLKQIQKRINAKSTSDRMRESLFDIKEDSKKCTEEDIFKQECVEYGIPLGLIETTAITKAKPTKSMPPLKLIKKSDIEKFLVTAREAKSRGEILKFDYSYFNENPFLNKTRTLKIKEQLEYEKRKKSKERDRHRDKTPPKLSSDKVEIPKTDLSIEDFVVCDSWSLDTEKNNSDSSKLKETTKTTPKIDASANDVSSERSTSSRDLGKRAEKKQEMTDDEIVTVGDTTPIRPLSRQSFDSKISERSCTPSVRDASMTPDYDGDRTRSSYSKATYLSLEVWNYVLNICKPIMFGHDESKCLRETKCKPSLHYALAPRHCDCVEERAIYYDELNGNKMNIVDRIYGYDQIPEDPAPIARTWYPTEISALTDKPEIPVPPSDTEPVIVDEVSSPVIAEEIHSPLTADKVPLPVTAQKVHSPVTAEKMRSPVTVQKVHSPIPAIKVSKAEKPEKLSIPEIVPQPVSDVEVTVDKVPKAVNSPKGPLPVTAEKVPLPVTKEKVSLPMTAEKLPLPVTPVKVPLPETAEKVPLPVIDVAQMPSLDDEYEKFMQSVLEEKNAEADKIKQVQYDEMELMWEDGGTPVRVETEVEMKPVESKVSKTPTSEYWSQESEDEEKHDTKKDKKIKKKKKKEEKEKTTRKKKKERSKSSKSRDSSVDSQRSSDDRSDKKKNKKVIKHAKLSTKKQKALDKKKLKKLKAKRRKTIKKLKATEEGKDKRKKPKKSSERSSKPLKKHGKKKKQKKASSSESSSSSSERSSSDNEEEKKNKKRKRKNRKDKLKPSKRQRKSAESELESEVEQAMFSEDILRNIKVESLSDEEAKKQISSSKPQLSSDLEFSPRRKPTSSMHEIISVNELHSDFNRTVVKIEKEVTPTVPQMEVDIERTYEEKTTPPLERIESPKPISTVQTEMSDAEKGDYSMTSLDGFDDSSFYESEMGQYMEGGYVSERTNEMDYASTPSSQETHRIETVVSSNGSRGEIKCDWRPSKDQIKTDANACKPSRWGMQPTTGEANIILTESVPSDYHIPTFLDNNQGSEGVYKIETISSNVARGSPPVGYDEAYASMYAVSDQQQYGDCFADLPMLDQKQIENNFEKKHQMSLDDRITQVLNQSMAQDEEAPAPSDKGILVNSDLLDASGEVLRPRKKKFTKSVSFADGFKPGQDSDGDETPNKKRKTRRYGCAWPCPSNHPDFVPLWDALPPPPPPPGSPPPPAPPPISSLTLQPYRPTMLPELPAPLLHPPVKDYPVLPAELSIATITRLPKGLSHPDVH